MAEVSHSKVWVMRAAFLGLALIIVFFHLLPLETVPRRWAPPDLLIAFSFAWVLRRPDYVPVLSIAAVMLVADLMLQRPPGLLALLVLLGCEYLKNRSGSSGQTSFAGEWLTVSLVIVAITLINRMVLALLAVDRAALGLSLIQMLMTIFAYPLVVLITRGLLGVRKPAPNDARALGARV